MDNVLGALLLTVLTSASLIGLLAALRALFPAALRRSIETVTLMPGRALLVGFVNVFFISALTIGLYALGQGLGGGLLMLPGLLLSAFGLALLAFGLATTAQLLGERLFPSRGVAGRAMFGSLVLILASLVPFAGWFVFLPYVILTGVGAFILAMLASRPEPDTISSETGT